MTELVAVTAQRRALNRAKTPQEAQAVIQYAEAAREAARRVGMTSSEVREWAILSLDAQRVAGRMLAEIPKRAGARDGKRSATLAPRLREVLDTDSDDEAKHRSSRWQRVAAIPDDVFQAYLDSIDGEDIGRGGLLHYAVFGGPSDPAVADDWYTPRWLFDQLGVTFDLDVCAPEDPAHQTVPALRHLTINDNGLTEPWAGMVWCNPPYSDPAPWIDRWAAHGNGMLLTHISAKSNRMRDVWRAAHRLVLFSGMKFQRPDGAIESPYWSLQLAANGPAAAELIAFDDPWAGPVFEQVRNG